MRLSNCKSKLLLLFSGVLVCVVCVVIYAALVLGTNCGFVLSAPTADPEGIGLSMSSRVVALRVTVPADADTITQVLWFLEASDDDTINMGLYTNDVGNENPEARIYIGTPFSKGTDAGWKSQNVSWDVSIYQSQIMWIAGLNGTGVTDTNYTADEAGERWVRYSSSVLPNPWTDTTANADSLLAICVVYTTADGGAEIIHYYRSQQ